MGVVIYCMHSCSTDESILQNESNIKTVSKERAVEFLQQNPLNLSGSKTAKTTTLFDYESITLETLTNSDQSLTVIPLAQNSKDVSRKILLVQIGNEIKSIIFTMVATSSTNSEHFSGKIIITNLNGVFINGFSVKDGMLFAKLKNRAPTNTTSRTITIDGMEFEELDEVVITNNYQNGPGKLNFLTLFNTHLEGVGGPYDGINWEFENNGGGGGSSASEPEPLDEVIITNSFKNNPCLKGVYDKLGGASTFQNYLKKFDGDFSVANLKLAASTNLPNTINAQTSPPSNYLITINFNENNLNRPSLDIARTFIHEMIHAEMFRILLSLSSTNGEIDVIKLNTMLTEHNYPGLYDYYRRYGVNNMQHEQMAAHYRGVIVDLVKEYDNTLTNEQYQAIAWVGLKGTVAWTQMSSLERKNITDLYNAWYLSAKQNCQ